MQFFQESLYLLRDLLAGYLSYELGSDLSKAIKNLRIPKERGYIDPNTTNLLEWDLMLLFDLFWSANIKIPNKESDKRLIETNISIIRKYRNKLAHMNRLDNYDVYRGIDNMILLCWSYNITCDTLCQKRDEVVKIIAKTLDETKFEKTKKINLKESQDDMSIKPRTHYKNDSFVVNIRKKVKNENDMDIDIVEVNGEDLINQNQKETNRYKNERENMLISGVNLNLYKEEFPKLEAPNGFSLKELENLHQNKRLEPLPNKTQIFPSNTKGFPASQHNLPVIEPPKINLSDPKWQNSNPNVNNTNLDTQRPQIRAGNPNFPYLDFPQNKQIPKNPQIEIANPHLYSPDINYNLRNIPSASPISNHPKINPNPDLKINSIMTENQEFPNPHHQRNFSSDKIASQNSGFYKQIPEIQGFKHENPVPLLPPQKYSNSTFQSGNQIQNPYANESRNQHKNPYVNETDSGPKSANNSDINTSQNQIPAFQNHNPDHYRNVPMSANKFQNQPNSNQTSNPYMNQGNINQGYPNQTDLDVQPSPKGFNANRSNFPPNQTNNFPEILTNSSSGMHLPSNYPNQMHTNYPANDQIERKTPQLHANPNFVSQSTNSSGNDPNQSSNEQEMNYGYQGGNYHQPLVQTAPKNLSDPTLSNPYQSFPLKMTDQSHLIYPVSSSSSPAANQYQASKSSPVYSTLSVVLKCAECKQALNDGYSLEHSKCHKTICMKCWKKLTQNNKNCPQCKFGLTEDEIFYIKSVAKN